MKLVDKRFLITFSILVIAWALVYKDALMAMEAIWSRSDTFAHGYFILPISLWLIWRDKDYLLVSRVQASWLPLPLLLGSLFVGLFSYAADINVLGQLSAVTSLIFLVWTLIGNKLVWRYKFPLAYLLFAVPMGENLIPWLQDVTAWFTVFFLKLNGIPVYVDGLYIQVPTGMFEVAVACSGIRYLIASAAVGALYGYLTYNKLYKQIVFFIFALTLPILANGIRAYGIVAIAYYSDMKYATGVDHLIYGWIFFGLIIMLMFWIGGFFADKLSDSKPVGTTADSGHFNYLICGVAIASLLLAFYIKQTLPHTKTMVSQIEQNKANIATNWGVNFNNTESRSYFIDSSKVEVFIASYANKQQGGLTSADNVLHDSKYWSVISKKVIFIDEKPVMLVNLQSKLGDLRSYIYQYRVNNFYLVNKNKVKLLQAWNTLFHQPGHSEVRAVSIAVEDELFLKKEMLEKSFNRLVDSRDKS